MKTIQINKRLFATCFAVISLTACSSSKDFLSDNFANVRNNHKRIAILPFGVQFQNPAEYSKQKSKQIQQQGFGSREQQASLDAQKELFIDVAKQVEKGRYEIAFQDFNKTNKVLSESGIRLEDIPRQNKADLARLLGVDAVIFGELVIKVTQMNNRNMMMPNYRNDDGVETDIKLFDAASGEMLWASQLSNRPNNRMDTPHQLSSSLLNQIAKNLPYRNK